MSASLTWFPKTKKVFGFDSNYDSDTIAQIKNAFGNEINNTQSEKLKHFYEATGKDIYLEIMSLVDKHDTIVLKVEY